MTAYILGKHESVLNYSHINWSEKESYGLNEAAQVMNTKYGFTGHESLVYFYGVHQIPFVFTSKSFEYNEINHPLIIDKIKSLILKKVLNSIKESDISLRFYLSAAKNNEDIQYPNYWSILHLAIFYLIKKGYNNIELIGCNNTKGDIPKYGSNTSEEKLKYVNYHTQKIINLAKELNINIIRHEKETI